MKILPSFISFLLLILAYGAGCDRSVPDNLIDEDKYIDILVEMHLLASLKEIDNDQKSFANGQEVLLEYYGIDREQFQQSHAYYHRDMYAQSRRYREVRKRLDEATTEVTDYLNKLRQARDEEETPSESS